MKSLRCLRGQQARITGRLPPRVATGVAAPSGAQTFPQPFRSVPVRWSSQTSTAVEDSKINADAELSNYKARRLERLESLQGGEEALFTETFPRLEHRTETMSVSDFLEAHNDTETPDNDSSAVTLYGMLLLSCAMIRDVKLSGSTCI